MSVVGKAGGNGRKRRLLDRREYVQPTIREAALVELSEEWLASCKARGLRARTLGYYDYSMRSLFLPWMAARGIHVVETVSQAVLDEFGAELLSRRPRGEQIAESTVAGYLRPVRLFLDWCEDQGLEGNGRPQLPVGKRKLIEILSRAEVQLLEDSAATERDKLIVRLLADCGLRVGELCRLDVGDLIQGEDGWWYLRVAGKAGRPRWAPLPRWQGRLRTYVRRSRPQTGSPALFVGLKRVEGDYRRLTESGVAAMVKWLGRTALPGRRVYPHLLRHSAITHYLTKGMNPFQVSLITGNFKNLDLYAHLKPVDAREAMLKALSE